MYIYQWVATVRCVTKLGRSCFKVEVIYKSDRKISMCS